MFEVEVPRSKAILRSELEKLHGEIASYLSTFSTEAFLAPQGEAWSPEGHLRHLVKSVRAVARAMGLPRLLLALRFGMARGASRSFEEMHAIYLEALRTGARAGRFGPSDRRVELPPERWREVVMERWQQSGQELSAALERWPERSLDRYRLPHPVLGKLTVREMLFFTLFHNAHHARRIHERAG